MSLLLECKLYENSDFVMFPDLSIASVVEWINWWILELNVRPHQNPSVTLGSKHKFINLRVKAVSKCPVAFSKEKDMEHLEESQGDLSRWFSFSSLHRREKNITSLIPIYVKANKNSICLNLILSKDDFFFKKTSHRSVQITTDINLFCIFSSLC